jgi:hypothetical protein
MWHDAKCPILVENAPFPFISLEKMPWPFEILAETLSVFVV